MQFKLKVNKFFFRIYMDHRSGMMKKAKKISVNIV